MESFRIALVIAALATGLFAGLMFTFSWVIQRSLARLSGSEYTRVMQELIHGADNPQIVPMIVIVGVIAPAVALFQRWHDRHGAAFALTLIGWLVFVLGVLVITVGFNAPINNTILQWPVESPPDDWRKTRDRWNGLNVIRTPAAALAFVLFLVALGT